MITKIHCNGLTIGELDSGYIFKTLSGFDYPTIRTNVKEKGNYHGARFGSAYYGARVMTIEGEILGTSPEDYEIKRRALGQAFTILNGLQQVTFTTRAGLVLRADCIVNNRLEIPYSAGLMQRGTFRIELVAPFPFFLSSTTNTTTVYVFEGGGAEIPAELPLTFSDSLASNVDINNLGNVEAYPIIRIHGVITDPLIKNNTSDLSLSLDYTLSTTAQFIEIDTYNHTVKRGDTGANIFSSATGDFWTLKTGLNNVVLSASSYGEGARAEIIYQYHYLGL
jgi:hypothetical protein